MKYRFPNMKCVVSVSVRARVGGEVLMVTVEVLVLLLVILL
jgi:hypothetical protein